MSQNDLLRAPGAARKLLSAVLWMAIGAISPDGKYILFNEFADNRATVYVARYPEFDRRMLVSLEHDARDPFFSADGSTIYYRSDENPAGRLFEVTFDSNASSMLGRPRPLFELSADSRNVGPGPGGEGFMVTIWEPPDDGGVVDARRGIRVVQNWTRKIEGPHP